MTHISSSSQSQRLLQLSFWCALCWTAGAAAWPQCSWGLHVLLNPKARIHFHSLFLPSPGVQQPQTSSSPDPQHQLLENDPNIGADAWESLEHGVLLGAAKRGRQKLSLEVSDGRAAACGR